MKQLNICIDIDGTITDPYYWLGYANNYFNLSVKKEEVTEYNISKVMNIKEEEYLKFYEEKKFDMHTNEPLRKHVQEILNLLSKDNNIFFITARDKSLELLTNIYLKYHNIPFDDVFVLGTHNKVPQARKVNCDIFVEDSYDNAIELSKDGFKVLLLDTNYNRHELNDKITRVHNWKEIYKIITKVSKNPKEEVV